MFYRTRLWLLAFLALSLSALCHADQLTMKDGQVLEGNFVSRSDGVVVFEIGGQRLNIPEASVESLNMTMGGDSAAPVAKPAPAPAATPPPKPKPKPKPTVATGTRLALRMSESLDSRSHKAGHRFVARLEADLVADGVVVAPRGTTAYGQLVSAKSSRRVAGSSEMTVMITDLLINNQMMAISTAPLQAVTENTAKKSTRQVARGAVIGGLISGSSGARDGAKVGIGASILSSGNQVSLPSGTLVETQLSAPFTPS